MSKLPKDHPCHAKNVGRRLKRWRESTGLKQVEICRAIGADQTNWNHWEKGRARITIEWVGKLKERYGLRADWIYFGEKR